MGAAQLDRKLISRLHALARAERWEVSVERFADVLARAVARQLGDADHHAGEVERVLRSLRLEDLALACACADGHEDAWDHFVREYRPVLYRAADAIDPSGRAREIADALYAELFGLRERAGERQSLFRYFHGRSSLSTWLRAVLAQRHVDRVRADRRTDPLPDEGSPGTLADHAPPPSPERPRHLTAMRNALAAGIAALADRDRLRLGCYYAQDLTLAQIGRALGEHEATVSRHLSRTRGALRTHVEERLRTTEGMGPAEIDECLSATAEDAGPLELADLLGTPRKDAGADRSR